MQATKQRPAAHALCTTIMNVSHSFNPRREHNRDEVVGGDVMNNMNSTGMEKTQF